MLSFLSLNLSFSFSFSFSRPRSAFLEIPSSRTGPTFPVPVFELDELCRLGGLDECNNGVEADACARYTNPGVP